MTCTTFLHDGELNQPLPDQECQLILEEARKRTGKDWQVVPFYVTRRKWFKKQTKTLYGVYVYVGGIGPWQQINFYCENVRSSINLYVPLEVVAAYLLGMLAVPSEAAHNITGEHMTECKHRWEPSNFGIKYRTPNHYMYQCQRCWKTISAILKEKK